jgi:hypothetical protein
LSLLQIHPEFASEGHLEVNPAGVTLEDVRRRNRTTAGGEKAKFPLVAFEDIRLSRVPVFLVKGLIQRVGLTLVYGAPKTGKSFVVLDIALHVALGREYRGRRVQQGSVVYCVLEGASAFNARIEAFRQRHLGEHTGRVPLYLMSRPLRLVHDNADLIASIRSELADERPAMVVIDTLNRSIDGSESEDKVMTAYVGAADALRDAFHCAVVVVHHSGIDASRPRGHTSLTGAADAQLSVKRKGDNVILEVECCKDGPGGDKIISTLDSFIVGQDDEGEPITSCVVVPADASLAVARNDRATRGLNSRQRNALSVLSEVTADRGEPPPPSFALPKSVRLVVLLDHWKEALFDRGVLDRDAKNPRADFQRVRDRLFAHKVIGVLKGYAWPVS